MPLTRILDRWMQSWLC